MVLLKAADAGEAAAILSKCVLIAFLFGYGNELVVAGLQVEMNGKVVAADRSIGYCVVGILSHKELAVFVVHHDNDASHMVVEEVGALRVVVVAEVQIDPIVARLKVVVHQRA